MLDGVTLDQLRTFIAAADEGSFSAAGRKLRRAQSVVSQTLANLELQLGVTLFDRSARYPRLTDEGRALLLEARLVADGMDGFKARARTMCEGLEPELVVVIDVIYPMAALTHAVGLFREHYPDTPLRMYVEALGAVIQPVLDGRCRIGVIGTLPTIPDEMQSQPLLEVPFVCVVSPEHPLAAIRGTVPKSGLSKHVQLVLTDRTVLSEGRDFGVVSAQTWRLADMGSKHAFLKAGFGWGQMPIPMVEEDLRNGTLVKIRVEGVHARSQFLPMHAVYRRDKPPGPAGRAFIEWLKRQSI
ncbi:MAG: LysR family transcriptional regulator [Rhodocyclales bacterium]|nr:LysR family transcriptional regulator [Rhodocyclales bacterium]